MQITHITDREQWNGLLSSVSGVNLFLQSWEWGEVLSAEGKTVERLAVLDGENVVALASVEYRAVPLGWRYAFCAGGPVDVSQELRIKDQEMYDLLGAYFKKRKCVFWRIEPASLTLNSLFLIHKVKDVNPSATVVLDLKKYEQELLAGMHAKTRYNIRVAEKHGVSVREEKNCSELLRLLKLTGARDGFRLHDEKHYAHVLASPLARQLVARAEGKIVATAVFIGFGKTFTYLFGASDYDSRALMAPYAVQWGGIQLGKKLGYKSYDWFGIAARKELRIKNQDLRGSPYLYDEAHQYAGVTRFKLGFGGTPLQRAGTFDLLLSPGKYRMYQVLRTVRRLV